MRACAGEIHVNQHFARDTFYGNLQENAAPKNLGPHFVRACAVEMHVNISQEPLFTEISGKTCRAQKPRTTLCASLRSRNALHFFARAISCGKLQKNAAPHLGPHFVQPCAIEMHVNFSQERLNAEIYRKNAEPQNLGLHNVRACAVEMHVNISQEPLFTEIYRKNASAQSEHPDHAPAG